MSFPIVLTLSAEINMYGRQDLFQNTLEILYFVPFLMNVLYIIILLRSHRSVTSHTFLRSAAGNKSCWFQNVELIMYFLEIRLMLFIGRKSRDICTLCGVFTHFGRTVDSALPSRGMSSSKKPLLERFRVKLRRYDRRAIQHQAALL